TKAFIALNLAVFVLTALEGGLTGRGGDLQVRLAVFGPAVSDGEWYRLVTSGFIHFGLIHVGFNMVLLYRFGELLEPALGRIRFAALYVAALLAGSAGALLVAPLALTGGASGAVFGMVAAAAVVQHRHGVGVWQSGIGGLLLLNLIFTFAIPNISIGGHIGGLVGGAALGAAMFRWPPSSASARSARATLEGVVLAAVVAAVAVAVALGAAAP
ncbi:MAG: rhomboid family intramembrane serine protease, partial [Actinobacteria bacterium]|nr:rhomboid family intramembrane serine protease [Actinomycetota bacterium]